MLNSHKHTATVQHGPLTGAFPRARRSWLWKGLLHLLTAQPHELSNGKHNMQARSATLPTLTQNHQDVLQADRRLSDLKVHWSKS